MESVQYFLPFPRFSLSFAFDSGEEQDTGEGRGRERKGEERFQNFDTRIIYIYTHTHIDTQRPEICIRLQQSNPFLRWKSEILVRRSTRRCTFGKRHRSRDKELEDFTC